MTDPERVVLLEDHSMVREGLVAGLRLDDRVDVVAAIGSLRAFRANVAQWQPSVVVADYRLSDGRGTELAAERSVGGQSYEVLIISGADERHVAAEAGRAGCAGFVSKAAPIEELVDAIVRIGAGERLLADELAAATPPAEAWTGEQLTQREREVLELLAATLPAAQIGKQLSISHYTVRNHIRSILAKLGAHTQLEAVLKAQRAGLIDPDGPGFERGT